LETGDLKLWRGPYLEDVAELGSRGESRNRLLLELRAAAGAALPNDAALAVRAGRSLTRMEPYDLEALRLLLQALRASNNRRDLVRAYAAAREKFLEVGTVLPEVWADFVNGTGELQTHASPVAR
jgi:Bacterial transcriptional activator domain